MTEKTKQTIHLIYGILLTIVTVIAGLCLMYSCYSIYTDGLAAGSGQIYSREIIQATFSDIAIPVYACLALVIGGFILQLALPLEKKKLMPEKNYAMILHRLKTKKAFSPDQESLQAAVERQQKQRRTVLIIGTVITFVCALAFLIPACRSSYWPDVNDPVRGVTDAMIGIMPLFAGCVVIPMGYCIFAAYFCRSSLRKEIELMKQASAPAVPVEEAPTFRLDGNALLIIRLSLLVLAVVGIILGAATGGVESIVAKAVAICTECIGLG